MQNIRLAVLATSLSFGEAGIASAQTLENLVSITVSGDSYFSKPHMIVIEADTHRVPRSAHEIETRRWRAIRTSDDRTDRISSDECPALREFALKFGEIASAPLRPTALTPIPHSMPIPPTMKDGFPTSLNYRAFHQDGSTVTVAISGGAFARWGHNVVSALLPCWGPLIPPPPDDLTAARLLQGLDLSSLPNSTEPSSAKSFNRPENWGFTQFRNDGDVATFERPDSRAISLKIVRWTPDGYIACFYDRHLTGGSYDTHATLRLVNDGRAGFKVAEQLAPDLTCLEPPKQDERDNSN